MVPGNFAPNGKTGLRGAYSGGDPGNYIRLSANRVTAGTSIEVTANLLDKVVTTVEANGIPLTSIALHVWQGSITAPATPGSYSVNIAYNNMTVPGPSFDVQTELGANGHAAATVLPNAPDRYLFRVWGRVTARAGNDLDITDGADAPVKVIADSSLLSGIAVGDFVVAAGILDGEGSYSTLQAYSVVREAP